MDEQRTQVCRKAVVHNRVEEARRNAQMMRRSLLVSFSWCNPAFSYEESQPILCSSDSTEADGEVFASVVGEQADADRFEVLMREPKREI